MHLFVNTNNYNTRSQTPPPYSASLMRDCARHFARKRQPARALQLFTKARDWEAALALCLRAVAKEEQRQKAGSSRKGSSSGSGGRGASQSQQLAALVEAGREIAQGLSQQASVEAATSASPLPPMSTELETGVGRLAALLERWGHAREAISLHLFRRQQVDVLNGHGAQLVAVIAIKACRGIIGIEDLAAVRIDQHHGRTVVQENLFVGQAFLSCCHLRQQH